MKIKINRTPDAVWFGTWKATPRIRDLGDYVIWFCGWEFVFYKKDNPWK